MKFFTRQLYEAQQGDPDLRDVIEADRQWLMASQAYQQHLQSIYPYLPKRMQEFSAVSLHDGVVRAVTWIGDEIQLQIAGCGCWGPGGSLELIFRGVKIAEGINDILEDWWLYEEVHLSQDAAFEYHVLFQDTELLVVADDVELIERN